MRGFIALVLSTLLILSSCSSADEEISSLPPASTENDVTQPSESNETGKDAQSPKNEQSQEIVSSPRVKPSKKSDAELDAGSSTEADRPGSYLTIQDFERSTEKYLGSKIVLFFNANWCSTCKIARDNIESNLDSIPSKLVIVVVDFDKETELRKRYGVTIQHTFIQIDENRNPLAKWSGSVTAEEIAERTV